MITEELLKQAAEEAEQAMADQIPEEAEHTFSAEFEEKMQKLREKAERPKVYPFLRRAACAVLALCLLGGVLLTNNQVRASVLGWVSEQYSGLRRYFVKEVDLTRPIIHYELGWLPEGYSLEDRSSANDGGIAIYKNQDEQMISLIYSRGLTSEIFVSEEDYTKNEVTISDGVAMIYISNNTQKSNCIVWVNAGVLFVVTADYPKDVLIQIAEGLKPM